MEVLLVGDLSSFHVNLKEGLDQIGHSVQLASRGDGFKKTSSTDLYMPKTKLEKILFLKNDIKKYFGHDIVQFVQYNNFGTMQLNYNYYVQKKIIENNSYSFLSSCGNNPLTYSIKDELRYNPYEDNIKFDLDGRNKYTRKDRIKEIKRISKLVDGIIPTNYTYDLAYKDYTNLMNIIPMPVNTSKIKYSPQNITESKLKIFHGITREGFKGTRYIKEAMEKLKENYPNEVEIIIDGKMPLKKYLNILEEANIVIDQALTYEYGVNAMYSMAMGKVVLSGNEPESINALGREDIPIINITPSVEDIYNKLEQLVMERKKIIEIGQKSRKFVEDFHDYRKVAQQYVNAWNSVKENE